MGKHLSMAASIFFMAIVALAAIGEAAIVEHTFVVSKSTQIVFFFFERSIVLLLSKK